MRSSARPALVAGITSSWDFAPGAPGCTANDTGNDQAFVVKLAM